MCIWPIYAHPSVAATCLSTNADGLDRRRDVESGVRKFDVEVSQRAGRTGDCDSASVEEN